MSSMFPHFITPVTLTNNAKRDAINVMYIAVEVSHHWKGEIFHFDGMKVLDKAMSHESPHYFLTV